MENLFENTFKQKEFIQIKTFFKPKESKTNPKSKIQCNIISNTL